MTIIQQPPPPPVNYGPARQGRAHFRRSHGADGPSAANYASWFARLLATAIDSIPVIALYGVGFGILMGTKQTECFTETSEFDLGPFCSTGASPLGQLSTLVAGLLGLFYFLWNYGYRQGTTGSSIGKSVMRFKVVRQDTGRPVGFGKSVLRQFAHFLDAIICYLGFLLPLWDAKRQTIADKVMTTVCVTTT